MIFLTSTARHKRTLADTDFRRAAGDALATHVDDFVARNSVGFDFKSNIRLYLVMCWAEPG
jgi:hypothetical protein